WETWSSGCSFWADWRPPRSSASPAYSDPPARRPFHGSSSGRRPSDRRISAAPPRPPAPSPCVETRLNPTNPGADMIRPGEAWQMVKTAAADWSEDKAPQLSAAITYYAIFSIAPLLVIAIAIAGVVYGEQAAQGQIV